MEPCTPSAPARRSRPSTFPRTLSATSSAGDGPRPSSSLTNSSLHRATSLPPPRRPPVWRPQLVIFFNKQFFTPGNVASSALQAAVSAAVADLPAGPKSSSFTPGPLVVEQYVLTNPALNYAQFLLRAILPTVLHIVIAIAG